MSRDTESLELGGPPRVDLMPAELRAKQRGAGVRRLFVLAWVLSLVVVGAGYALATVHAAAATADLQAAQERSQLLLAEQLEYSEVTTVARQSASIVDGGIAVTATEVLWKDVVDPILGALPADSTVVSIVALGRTFADPELTRGGPLREPLVGRLTIIVTTPTVFDVTGWMRRVEGIPLVSDLVPTTVALSGGGYQTTIDLSVDVSGLSGRFAVGDEESTDADENTEEDE